MVVPTRPPCTCSTACARKDDFSSWDINTPGSSSGTTVEPIGGHAGGKLLRLVPALAAGRLPGLRWRPSPIAGVAARPAGTSSYRKRRRRSFDGCFFGADADHPSSSSRGSDRACWTRNAMGPTTIRRGAGGRAPWGPRTRRGSTTTAVGASPATPASGCASNGKPSDLVTCRPVPPKGFVRTSNIKFQDAYNGGMQRHVRRTAIRTAGSTGARSSAAMKPDLQRALECHAHRAQGASSNRHNI